MYEVLRVCVCVYARHVRCQPESVNVPAKVPTTDCVFASACVDEKQNHNTHNIRKRERKEEKDGYNTTMFPGGPPPQY